MIRGTNQRENSIHQNISEQKIKKHVLKEDPLETRNTAGPEVIKKFHAQLN